MTTPAPPPGLQPQRTQLAWTRTALSFGAITALLAHADTGAVARVLLLVLAVAGTCAFYVSGRMRQRDFANSTEPAAAAAWMIAVPTALTAALGIVSAIVAFT